MLKPQGRSRFADELRIIPGWAIVLAVIAFASMQIVFNVVIARQPDAPPMWGRIPLGILVGGLFGCLLLLIGYVNRDAGRRGMNRLLWTLVAIFVTNGLGIILYFLLRQPLLSSCPQCKSTVQNAFNYCPRCNCRLHPSCPVCQHEVEAGAAYCPYCGKSIENPPAIPSIQANPIV